MYKVHFVNDEQFEALPGQNMGTKVGVAYPEYGEAYVRKSGSNLVDVFSAMHELEHLQGDSLNEHFDSENKCYYKGFADVMGPVSNIAAMIPGPWQVPAMAYSGYNMFAGGGGKGQQQQQNPYDYTNQGTGEMQQPSVMDPFVSQAQGAGGGANSAGSSGGTAVKQLSSQPNFNNSQDPYGRLAGR